MRIAAVETVPLALPFRETYRTAAGELDRRESLLVRLAPTTGSRVSARRYRSACAAAVPLAAVRDEIDAGGCRARRRRAAGARSPKPRGSSGGCSTAAARAGISRVALCGLDIALHDLAARRPGQPVWRADRRPRARPRPLATARSAAVDPETAARTAAEHVARGLRTSIKVKVGDGDDEARIGAVREATGPKAVIRSRRQRRVVAASEAIEMRLRRSAPLELIEQPAPTSRSWRGSAAATHTPIVADESIASFGEARAIAGPDACNATTVKLSKVGGIREAMRIAEIVPDLPLERARRTRRDRRGGALRAGRFPRSDTRTARHRIALRRCPPAAWPQVDGAGRSRRLAGPGLGIEIDEDALERLRIR